MSLSKVILHVKSELDIINKVIYPFEILNWI